MSKTKTKPQTKSAWEPIRGPMGGVNYLLDGEGFYVSYNPNTCGSLLGSFFGGDGDGEETALCVPKGRKDGGTLYLILNGDFREDYEKLAPQGLDACKAFFEGHKGAHRSSWTQDE